MVQKQNCPGLRQPKSTWSKPYWNFDDEDWQNWIDSFKTFPVGEYDSHISSIIDMFMPDETKINWI